MQQEQNVPAKREHLRHHARVESFGVSVAIVEYDGMATGSSRCVTNTSAKGWGVIGTRNINAGRDHLKARCLNPLKCGVAPAKVLRTVRAWDLASTTSGDYSVRN